MPQDGEAGASAGRQPARSQRIQAPPRAPAATAAARVRWNTDIGELTPVMLEITRINSPERVIRTGRASTFQEAARMLRVGESAVISYDSMVGRLLGRLYRTQNGYELTTRPR